MQSAISRPETSGQSTVQLATTKFQGNPSDEGRSRELSYLAPLGSEKISAPYFKQCFFRGGYYLLG
jgi:hypothetical protein